MRFSHLLFVAPLFAITCLSCSEKGGRNIDQGEIHYNITYSGSFGPMPREVLPKNLVVSFKHNKILFEMISPFGNSGIQNLSNPDKGFFDTYFSLFTLKYYYSVQPGEQFPGFETMSGTEVKKTEKTMMICGYNCHSAEVIIPGISTKPFEVWYTNEIDVKNPNAATPFSSIDGVLMSFFFIFGPAELHFEAENVYKKDISDKIFDRKDRFQRVSRKEIDRFINKMITL